jgi:ASC-1-like (ASCH) protein
MTKYEMRVCEPYFSHIKKGDKFVEGRLKKGKWAAIQPDDHILIVEPTTQETILKRVKFTVTCNNFRELYFLYNDCFLPGILSPEDAEFLCHSYYSQNSINSNDVIGLIFYVDWSQQGRRQLKQL